MSFSQFVPVRVLVLFLLVGFVLPGTAIAQNQPPDDQDQPVEESDAEGDGEEPRSRRGSDEEGVKPYAEVITDEAETDEGVFTVHRLDQKVFYEIPVSELGLEFLWVSQIASANTTICRPFARSRGRPSVSGRRRACPSPRTPR